MKTRLAFGLTLTLVLLDPQGATAGPDRAETAPEAGLAQPQAVDSDLRKLGEVLRFLRERNAGDHAISAPRAIDEARYVSIGGIDQWITIRGEDRENPLLLFLHGGPGDATTLWGDAFFRPWLRHFTVVQWDQRGAGRTLGRSGPSVAPTITIERLTRDGIELAELLRKELRQEKIVLVGHSWGSILGIFMAKARPDLFHALVGTGQVANPARNYSVAYTELLAKAERLGEESALRELREVGPPPYANGRGYAIQRKWSNRFEGADIFLASTLTLALTAPGSSLGEVHHWLEGQGVSAQQLVPVTAALDAAALGGEFRLPVLLIQGAEDFTTPTSLARSLLDSLRAPRKELITLDGGGHFAVFMKSEAFLKALVDRVLPLISPSAARPVPTVTRLGCSRSRRRRGRCRARSSAPPRHRTRRAGTTSRRSPSHLR